MKLKFLLFLLFTLIISIQGYMLGTSFNDTNSYISNETLIYLIAVISLVVLYIIVRYILDKDEIRDANLMTKLFKLLIEESDTAYFMYDNKKRQVVYKTKNLKKALGIPEDSDKQELKAISELIKKTTIGNEIRSWDEISNFTSQMVLWPSELKKELWIRIKIYSHQSKKQDYYIVVVSDVSAEHKQRHLLVSQANDIKTREHQLNKITAAAYDVKFEVNLKTSDFSLKNLKIDSATDYFGTTRSGKYEKEIEDIVNNYVSEDDRSLVLDVLSIKNFKKQINKDSQNPISVRYGLANKDEPIWLESTVFFTNIKGEEIATVLTKNVTENAEYMRNQNLLLQFALSESKKANKAKSNFLKVLSHEIRTPLTTIIGLSETLINENIDEKVKDDIGSINTASNDLLGIINGILDISKIEQGIQKLDEVEYNVPNFFESILTVAKQKIKKKPIEVELNMSPNMPFKLFGDSSKIRQILLNLINNACQYTEKGKISIDASFRNSKPNAELIVSVVDSGCGMSDEKISEIFESSENKEIDFNDYKEGKGLGILISKTLINSLKGKMEVESKEGIGTTFTIYVNQKVIDDTPISSIISFKNNKKKVVPFSAKGKSVLVVDDDKLNLKVAVRLLNPYELDVETVETGKACVDLIGNGKKYDLILLDQMMPEMDGIETLSKLKKMRGFKTPVIVLTADAIVGVKDKYLKEGFDGYLSKPIDTRELDDILKKYLQK